MPANPETVYQGDSTLPPAGDERREVLAERKDTLEQKSEEIAASVDMTRVDPSKVEPIREIQYELMNYSGLDVSNKQLEYDYCWVTQSYPANTPGLKVMEKLARHVSYNGEVYPTWEVVKGDMPEASNRKQADGTRRLGDCILLRIRKDIHAVIKNQERTKRQVQQDSVTAKLEEISYKSQSTNYPRAAGADVYRTGNSTLNKMHSQQMAKGQLDTMIRQGTVPGFQTNR